MTPPAAAEFTFDPDPRRLGAHLVERLRAEQARAAATVRSGRAPSPIAVVTPTLRLRDHVQRHVTRALGATAGVEFLLHADLAARALTAAGRPLPTALSPAWLAQLLKPRFARSGGALAAAVARAPATLAPLLATCRDLRDAGFLAAELAAIAPRLGPTAQATLALHREFERLLTELADDGFGDAASRTRAALAVAPRPLQALLHYGAYELTGATRALVAHALPERAAFFVPTDGRDRRSGELAAAFGAPDTPTGAASDRPRPARSRCHSAATPRDELRLALRQLLAWHARDGIPLDELALLSRSPGSHAAVAVAEAELHEGAFAGPERPWSEHAAGSALRRVIAHLRDPHDRMLARVARRSWPAGWPTAEPLSRRLDAATSLAERIELLREPITEPQLAAALDAAASIARALAGSAAAEALPSDRDGALDLVGALLEETGAATRVGSIELLDLHQARGLCFRRAVWIGANEKLLPRPAREDYFLPDLDRARLSAATGRPLARAADARDDEALLLDSARATVAEELSVSYARSDGEREQLPSPWLDRLVAPGGVIARSRHPLHQLDELRETSGLLAPNEALLLALPAGGAIGAELPTFAGAVASDAAALARAWRRAAATEAWNGRDFAFDGVIGGASAAAAALPATSPSRLERLGRCPLQHFFADVLAVPEPEEPSTSGELDARRRGQLFHAVLEGLYRQRFPPPPPDPRELGQRVAPPLPDPASADHPAFVATLEADLRARLAAALASAEFAGAIAPALLPVRLACYAAELTRFVLRDWRRLAARGVVAGEFELGGTFDVAGTAPPLPLRMRFDRILVDSAGGEHVGDYKSARTVSGKASLTAALRGQELQLALYGLARLAAGRPLRTLELLSLDPRHGGGDADGDADDDGDDDAGVVELDVARLVALRPQLVETLRVLEAVRGGGAFPLAADDSERGVCGRCAYAAACRHTHGATRARVAAAEFAQPWRALAALTAPRASGRKPSA